MLNSVVSRALIHCLSVSQLSHVPLCALMFRLVYWCAACVLWLMFCSAVWTDVPPVCSDVPLSALNWCATLCTDVPIMFWFAVVTWCAANLCARIHLMLSIDADFAIPWTCQTPQQYCPTSPSSWFPVGRNFLSHAEVSLADLWHVMARGADFGRRLLASVISGGCHCHTLKITLSIAQTEDRAIELIGRFFQFNLWHGTRCSPRPYTKHWLMNDNLVWLD